MIERQTDTILEGCLRVPKYDKAVGRKVNVFICRATRSGYRIFKKCKFRH